MCQDVGLSVNYLSYIIEWYTALGLAGIFARKDKAKDTVVVFLTAGSLPVVDHCVFV